MMMRAVGLAMADLVIGGERKSAWSGSRVGLFAGAK
jgi:hypothetical protein